MVEKNINKLNKEEMSFHDFFLFHPYWRLQRAYLITTLHNRKKNKKKINKMTLIIYL